MWVFDYSPSDFTFPSTPSNYNFTLELYDGDNFRESSTTWIHIAADYIKSTSLSIEPFLDLDTQTFYTVTFDTISELVVPQGYDNGVTETYTSIFIEFDWSSGYADDLGYGL